MQVDPQWDEINITLHLADRRHSPIRLTREEIGDLEQLISGVGATLTQGKKKKA